MLPHLSRHAGLACLIATILIPSWAGAEIFRKDFKEIYKDALAAVEKENWEKAKQHLDEALHQNPREGDLVRLYGVRYEPYLPHYYLGLCYFHLRNYEGALREWETSEKQQAVQRTPEYAHLEQYRAEIQQMNAGGQELAVSAQTYEDALKILDLTQGCTEEVQEAIRLLQRASNLPPGTRTRSGETILPNLKLAEALVRCKQYGQARHYLQRARLHEPAATVQITTLEHRLAELPLAELDLGFTRSYALVVGASNYEAGWNSLPGVAQDVEAVARALRKHDFDVRVLKDPRKRDLEEALGDLFYGKPQDSRLLLYFAGHGYTLRDREEKFPYIVPVDAPAPGAGNEGEFKRKAIPMARFQEYIQATDAQHVLLVFDSCFSGAVFDVVRSAPENVYVEEKVRYKSRAFITAGEGDQKVPDESFFRKAFVEALEAEGADRDHDGVIFVGELHRYIFSYLGDAPQKPQFGISRDFQKGDFPLRSPGAQSNPEKEQR